MTQSLTTEICPRAIPTAESFGYNRGMSDRRDALLAEYAALPPAGSPDRGDAVKRFCCRWETRIWGLHRHYKGGLYIAHGLAIVEADLTVMVAYTAADGSQWLRAVENFLGEASPGVRRFRRVRPKSPSPTERPS